MYYVISKDSELYHHGIKGQKWGVRRFQNEDMTWTEAGKRRYGNAVSSVKNKVKQTFTLTDKQKKALKTAAIGVGSVAAVAIIAKVGGKSISEIDSKIIDTGVQYGRNAVAHSRIDSHFEKVANRQAARHEAKKEHIEKQFERKKELRNERIKKQAEITRQEWLLKDKLGLPLTESQQIKVDYWKQHGADSEGKAIDSIMNKERRAEQLRRELAEIQKMRGTGNYVYTPNK